MADAGGLYLYLSPSGAKLWRIKYRFMGKEKILSLGQYPNISLTDARKRREEAKDLLARHIDPSLAKHQLKQQARLDHGNTFETVAREWLEDNKDNWSADTSRDKLTRLERYLFPHIGKMAIKDVTPKILLAALKKVHAQGRHEVTKRLQQSCNQIFYYAVRTEICPNNPMQSLKSVIKPHKVKHHPTIDSKELPQFLHELAQNKARLFPQTILAVELLMLTFVRTSELIQAKWPEIDFENKEWRIPAHRMKIKNSDHIVPLSRQCIAILKELQELARSDKGWVLPSVTLPRKHISTHTILQAIKRMGYKGRMTGHGFRALAMTTLKERLNYRHEVVDRQLAHGHRNSIDAAYDRAQFLTERRKMMQDWANFIDGSAQQGKVIQGHFGIK